MKVSIVDRSILETAILSNLPDFEDAVQLACAMALNLDVIVTRDPQGFTYYLTDFVSRRVITTSISES